MREKYETLKLNDLRDIAKKRGIKGATAMKKSEIIDLMCELDEKEKNTTETEETTETVSKPRRKNIVVKSQKEDFSHKSDNSEEKTEKKTEPAAKEEPENEVLDGDSADGILEIMQDGYGFIRCENYLPGENDVYVAPSLIRKFNLKTGDILTGTCRAKKETDKFAALLRLDTVNGYKPEVAMGRWNFENMTPIFPNSRIRL